ncbi:hypothetical protein [Treponema sp.]|uniref:hypothetical protein n=1 Tax=Treponema sp. TaxID=166 RepID=UPI0025E11A81|nr:hypothetical protein [Treponema sp.]MCR5217877.1 hypothetical protein [Treponema sp.]
MMNYFRALKYGEKVPLICTSCHKTFYGSNPDKSAFPFVAGVIKKLKKQNALTAVQAGEG